MMMSGRPTEQARIEAAQGGVFAPTGPGRTAHPEEVAASRRRRRIAGWTAIIALSLAGHVAAVLLLLSARTQTTEPFDPEPMAIALVDLPKPPPPPPPPPVDAEKPAPTPAPPAPVNAKPLRNLARPTKAPVPPDVKPLPALNAPVAFAAGELSDGQLASATAAGSGAGSGGGCDVARRLQNVLQKNPRVQAALVRTPGLGRGSLVWNGDWIRNPAQDGAGLAVIREAIMMEVLSAPEACRREPMRGLYLISLNHAGGAARVAVGADSWRWGDLLLPPGMRRR
jgi:hypothetical protein